MAVRDSFCDAFPKFKVLWICKEEISSRRSHRDFEGFVSTDVSELALVGRVHIVAAAKP